VLLAPKAGKKLNKIEQQTTDWASCARVIVVVGLMILLHLSDREAERERERDVIKYAKFYASTK